MKLTALGIEYDNGKIKVLDQTLLPNKEIWIQCDTIEDMCHCINTLQVRGAPLIGLAALLALAQFSIQGATKNQIIECANRLSNTRPTAVNLKNYLNYLIEHLDEKASNVASIARMFFNEDVKLCDEIAKNGCSILSDNETVMTYCNTGGLATAGSGTALGIIKKGYLERKIKQVYVCETRPLLQGARLTAWELTKLNIPYTLICDNMAAFVMQKGLVDRVITGADRIAENGDSANKIGTYNLAVLANYHNIPFHIAAPNTTFDTHCISGEFIKIEERDPDEVRGVKNLGIFSPENAAVYNPAFDLTPTELITSIISNLGIHNQAASRRRQR